MENQDIKLFVVRDGAKMPDNISKTAKVVKMEIPPSTWMGDSFFVFALHKSGSTLLNRMLMDLGRRVGAPHISVENDLRSKFGAQINPQVQLHGSVYPKKGYIHGGYRHFPRQLPGLKDAKKLLLVRDPKDILTSYYFSIAFSHRPPSGNKAAEEAFFKKRDRVKNMDINDFVIEWAPNVRSEINRYLNQLPKKNLRVYHYEDVIFKKEQWLENICDFVGFDARKSWIKRILEVHDVVPGGENKSSHIRKVAPGDHLEKLSADTIKVLDGMLPDFSSIKDYAVSV